MEGGGGSRGTGENSTLKGNFLRVPPNLILIVSFSFREYGYLDLVPTDPPTELTVQREEQLLTKIVFQWFFWGH